MIQKQVSAKLFKYKIVKGAMNACTLCILQIHVQIKRAWFLPGTWAVDGGWGTNCPGRTL